MATITATRQSISRWRDYLELTKPKVVALLVLTAWVGMMLASPGLPDIAVVVFATIGIGLLSGAAAALNHVVDQRIDAQMARTHSRPVAKGRVSSQQAIAFACALAATGFVLLYLGVNPLTAWLTLLSLFGYAVVYTMFLKRATPQNIVIGGLAGAMPPLLGWTAVSGEIHGYALLLVMIIFAWTPPHFWALAIHRRDDYAKVNMPMLPVTHGIEYTKSAILLYTVLLCLVCLLPYIVGMTGAVYLLGSTLLNLRFLQYAWKLKFNADSATAMATFKFSIVHLMVLFLVLLLDHYFKVSPFYVS
ncbi:MULTISPECIES: heme o synthase [unclassified Arsukibacterium]|uniref:heme o synthase n=1 Tax=unclassified Arsukibacterium TaxID=2635278 RepID=UPI000C50C390|nr:MULTISPECIES: heme o synthase [unclassified Arsukibacterium]MAA94838.1 protoheme IX farnesyltransferase [Rheinheimera sp.]MBM34705.1 protoheme IX farnesyltransferase [Rheinheimera sp.]HAW93012.1 protoheme IX farnesyltransferase [Candidatus Azambacteria bacterium]|tara:strand:+ start:242 stop:1153 length:912 start_codon:yes stop_codon:yes gene_type:complete